MKFLVTTRAKDVFMMLPLETQVALMSGMLAFMDNYLKAGKCKEAYMHSDMQGGVSIWEVDSAEEGARLTLENPAAPFQNIEIMPIVEWNVGAKMVREAYEKAAKK